MKRGYLADDEFIRSLHAVRMNSPIIDELCERLEHKPGYVETDQETVSCPACESVLGMTQDLDDGTVTLKLRY